MKNVFFFEVDVQRLEKSHKLHNDLPFLPQTMKIEKVAASLHDKTEYVIHTRNSKQALNHALFLNIFSPSPYFSLYLDSDIKTE